MVTGGCLCDAIKYEISASLQFARNCHCAMSGLKKSYEPAAINTDMAKLIRKVLGNNKT